MAKKKQLFVIAETPPGHWLYHLRKVNKNIFLGGKSNLVALCGEKLGWDTLIPLSSWGLISHIPTVWCKQCEKIGKELKIL